MRTVIEDFIYETELDYKLNESKYTIYKLIHDLNYSTKCPKWYPEDENNAFYLNKEEANDMAVKLFNNLDNIENIDNIISNLDEIKRIVMKDFCKKKIL